MPIPLAAVGLATGLVGSIGKMFGRGAANRRLRRLMKDDPVYKENPLARQRLGLAKTLLNARMPGAASVERNINSSFANTVSNAQRGATDSNSLLLAGSAAQGQANQSFENLGVQEAQDYQRRFNNYVGANEGVIQEGDKVFNDNVRRFENKLQAAGAQNENRQNTWGDISKMGFALSDFGMAGGFKSLMGGGNGAAGRTLPPPTMGNYPNAGVLLPGAMNPTAMSNMANIGYPTMGNYGIAGGRYNPITGQIE